MVQIDKVCRKCPLINKKNGHCSRVGGRPDYDQLKICKSENAGIASYSRNNRNRR